MGKPKSPGREYLVDDSGMNFEKTAIPDKTFPIGFVGGTGTKKTS